MPPGTITTTDKQGVARRLPGSTPVAYAYWGNKPHLLTCGIALYVRVPDDFAGRIVASVGKKCAGWRPRSSYPDGLSGAAPAHHRYWGQPNDPDRNGVLILTRNPADTAPTLEVEVHLVAET